MSETVAPQKDKLEKYNLPVLADICTLTADLPVTPERKRLLAAMALPQAHTMSHIDICEYANISPRTYYNATKDPTFNALQVKLGRSLIKSNALKHLNKYDEIAMKGDRQALERFMEQQGTLDPPQRNVNLQGAIVNTSLTELVNLIKEQKVEDRDINDIVEAIVVEQDGEGSTPEGEQVTGIPKENIGPSLSEKIIDEEK